MTSSAVTSSPVAPGPVTSRWATARYAWPTAAGLGVLSSFGFDPIGIPYAMVVGVAGLIWLARVLRDARKRTVATAGFLYGLAFMGPLIWWMNAVSHGAYIGLVLAETAFYVPIMLALRGAVRLKAWPLWGAAVWVAGEYARGTFPFTGFPWGRLAHTSIDTPFQSYARLVAMPGTSAVLSFVAGLLVVIATASAWAPRVWAGLAIIGLVGIGLLLPTGIAGADGTRQVALVQGDVPGVFLTWPIGAIFQLHAKETDYLADQIESGAVPHPDMVLWPENSTDTDPYHDQAVRDRIQQLSARLDAPILVGGIFDGPTVDTAYNAGVVWDANGPGARYVKRKPVPFGEYVPFRRQASAIVNRFARDIPRDMLAGHESGALQIGDTLIGDTICYDIAYDDVTRQAVNGGAQLLVVQTSNAAFTGTAQPEQQWDISRLRAIETGRWVAVPSTNGISGFVDPHGHSVKRAPMHKPAILDEQVELASGTTPALKIGQPVEYLLVTLGLGGWFLGTRKREG
ncbi:MAG: lnt [Aeromicrobium sp.]|nr:lnt [Aeromicrobium sp.]